MSRPRALFGAAAAATVVCATVPAAAQSATAVTIQLDGALATQASALQALSARGMHGTVYVNSGLVGTSKVMSWEQLGAAAQLGHEIGGFSVGHTSYTGMPIDQVRADACADRQALLSHGFGVTSFAYAFGLPATEDGASIESAVRNCGFDNARTTTVPDGAAESVPPVDAMATRAFQWDAQHQLSDLEGAVTRAEAAGGGWVQYAFQDICDGCDPKWAISPAVLGQFLDWLAPRAANGTVVRSVSEVLRGAGVQTSNPFAPPPAPPGGSVGGAGGGSGGGGSGNGSGSGTSGTTLKAPTLGKLKLVTRRIGRKATVRATFTLSRAATIRVTSQRRSGRRWVRTAQVVTLQGRKGTNRVKFPARLLRLSRGSYRLGFVAVDASGLKSKQRTVTLSVVR